MQLFAILGLDFLFMFGFWLSKATGEQHREAYFITLMFLWALKSFIKSLTKFLLFIAYWWCLADISSALLLSSYSNVLMTTLYSIVQDDIQDVLIQFSITPRDISSVPVHPISEGTNLKIGKCYSDIPGHSLSGNRGLTAGHP